MTHFEAIYNLDPCCENSRRHGSDWYENGREEALQLLLSSLNFNPSDNVLYAVAWIYATAANESLRNGSKALEIAVRTLRQDSEPELDLSCRKGCCTRGT